MSDKLKLTIVVSLTIAFCFGVIGSAFVSMKYFEYKTQECHFISKYKNTPQHDINLQEVCQ